jgi:hypothetical protein
MIYFDNDRVKIYYEIEGEGSPIVLIYGLMNVRKKILKFNIIMTYKHK